MGKKPKWDIWDDVMRKHYLEVLAFGEQGSKKAVSGSTVGNLLSFSHGDFIMNVSPRENEVVNI